MFDLNNIYYPSYAIAIPKAKHIIYIPTQGSVGLFSQAGEELNLLKYQSIRSIKQVVLEGYEYKNKLCFYDALSVTEFNNKKCNLIYEDRLKLLHKVIYSYLAELNLYVEAINEKVSNPQELKNFYAYCLTNQYKGVIIKNAYGAYTWGSSNKDHIELTPKG